ncbi:erythromycin esterase family protein [Actinomadura rugatobispora]|uniref:Erythromycin esterase family protein n=1 Tax=Actinomadura rugatobispora TaxID=1994 RepID=A0ABW1A452_9ACTN
MRELRAAVTDWIEKTALPLITVDASAPLDDLRPLLGMLDRASVVGYGGGTRGAHEFFAMQLRIARLLVGEAGFRAIAFDQDWTLGVRLDTFVRTGAGDPRALLKEADAFTNTAEVLALIEWMRTFNESHPDDPVRFVGVSPARLQRTAYDAVTDYVHATAPQYSEWVEEQLAALRPGKDLYTHIGRFLTLADRKAWIDSARAVHDQVADLPGNAWALRNARLIVQFYELHDHDHRPEDPFNMAYMERAFAENIAWWNGHFKQKVLFWSSSSHSSNGPGRAISFPPKPIRACPNAGSHLRERLGTGYASLGLTFHDGELATYADTTTYKVPGAAPELAESVLNVEALDAYLLDLTRARPRPVDEWLSRTAKFRAIGPVYDPSNDGAHHMTGGSPAEWFDAIVHIPRVTPARVVP